MSTPDRSANSAHLLGLDERRTAQLTDDLNFLLANYQVFYMTLRSFHWNITGEKFFELHAKFEELYTDALTKIDEIAERILTLGATPLHTFSDYVQAADMAEARNVSDGREAVQKVLDGLALLIRIERKVMGIAEEAADEGTAALMSDYLREQEKLVWMYGAYLRG